MTVQSSITDKTPESPQFELTVRGIAEAIKQMEVDLGLLEDESFGREARLAWEAYRVPFYNRLKKRFVGFDQAHSFTKKRGTLERGIRSAPSFLRASLFKNPFLMPRGRPFLFLSHLGGVKDEHGYYWNRTTDPVISTLSPRRVNNIEMARAYTHLEPTPNPKQGYSDFLDFLASIRARFWGQLPVNIRFLADAVERYLQNILGISEQIKPELLQTHRGLSAKRYVYRSLVRILKPQVVFLVCSYGKEGIVLACQDNNVPVVEFQHGVITNEHLGYAVPVKSSKISSPDYLLTFGTHWHEIANHSQKRDHLVTIGFPFLEREWTKYKKIEKDIDVLFVSQGTIGQSLSQFAISFLARLDQSLRVVYKLHRGEMFKWRTCYPDLARREVEGVIEVIDTADAGSFYRFLSRSKNVVGGYSSGLFESLRFGCCLFLIDLPGIEYMETVIRAGLAKVVHDPGELLFQMKAETLSPGSLPFTNQLFAENWEVRFHNFLKSLACKSRTEPNQIEV